MMSKLTRSFVVLGICGLMAAGLSACSKQAGPLSPSINVLGAGSTPNSGSLVRVSSPTLPTNVSSTAQVAFNVPLNPASVNASTVLMYTLDAGGTSETQFTGYTLSYNPLAKMIVIAPAGGAWPNDQAYHLVLTPGLQSMSGRPLDGNGNTLAAESSEFDSVHYSFVLGAPGPTTLFSTTDLNSRVTYAASANGSALAFNNGAALSFGNLAATSHVFISVTFTVSPANPSDFQMDTSTFFTDAATLHPNIMLTDASGAPVTPVNVTLTSSVANAYNALHIELNMPASTTYKLRLKGGLTGIRSGQASTLRLRRGFYLDGNANGMAEQSDDSKAAIFGTGAAGGGSNPRVRITGIGTSGLTTPTGQRRFAITFNVEPGTGILDPASINASTITLYNDSTKTPVVPSSIYLDNAQAPNPVVYVFVPLRIIASGTTGGAYNMLVFVSKNVKSSDGVYLDGNGDGITGTDADNYQSPIYSVNNY